MKKRWIVSFGIVILLMTAVFLLFKKLPNSEADFVESKKINQDQASSLPSSYSLEVLNQEPEKNKMDARQLSEIRKCLPALKYSDSPSFNEITEILLDSLDLSPELEQYIENQVFHIQLENNELRRLRLYDERGVKRMGFYKVDQDGDPVPIDLPVSHQFNPRHEVIQDYLSSGRIIKQEKDYLIPVDSSTQLVLNQVDSNYKEFQLKMSSKFLGCNITSCRCIQ